MASTEKIALVMIPHQRPAKVEWYRNGDEIMDVAAEFAEEEGLSTDHGFDDPVDNAAHTLGDDMSGHILVRSLEDAKSLLKFRGHQHARVIALAKEIIDEFSAPPDAAIETA